MEFIALASNKGTVTNEERIDFLRKTKAARFLFNKEADDYFTHLNAEAIHLQVVHKIVSNAGSVEGMEDTEHNRVARIVWFNKQLDELPKEFDRFLTVEDVSDSKTKLFSARFTQSKRTE